MKKFSFCVLMAGAVLLLSSFAQTQSAGNVENGKRLYLTTGCYQCHGYAGQGGGAGARLSATPLNVQAFIQYTRRPTTAMPAYVDKILSDRELTDIHAYVKSMPAPKAAKDIPLLNQLKNR